MYATALRHAEVCLRRFGRKTINGKDAHDFAIDSLRTVPWKRKRIWFDMLDGFRAEARRQKRWGSQIPFEDAMERHATSEKVQKYSDWFSAYWFLTDRQREVALLLSHGWSMAQVGRWLGISENAMSKHRKRIAKRIAKYAVQESKATELDVRQRAGDGRAMGEEDPEEPTSSEEVGREEEVEAPVIE